MMALSSTLLGNGLFLLSRLTARTGHFQVTGLEHLAAQRAAARPAVLAAWHGMTMMLAGFFLNGYIEPGKLAILLPDDSRGQNLATWARRLGARPFCLKLHGDNSLASARQLARLVRLVKEGSDCYVTPDGPDGPAYQVKPGVAYIAQRTGSALLPLGAYTRTGYRLNRWDQYTVPRPYSRISLVIGEPLTVLPTSELPAICAQLTAALHHVADQAAANYYEKG